MTWVFYLKNLLRKWKQMFLFRFFLFSSKCFTILIFLRSFVSKELYILSLSWNNFFHINFHHRLSKYIFQLFSPWTLFINRITKSFEKKKQFNHFQNWSVHGQHSSKTNIGKRNGKQCHVITSNNENIVKLAGFEMWYAQPQS